MANKKLRTAIIKPRTQGGTFYTFSSAMEDIGLNVTDSKNRVMLSHYALLDIPQFDDPDYGFDTLSTTEFTSDVNIGNYKFAEGFENYVLNMETVMRNQDGYNFANYKTVSERVFWKWLRKSCLKLEKFGDTEYYKDTNKIVKSIGLISSSSERSDEYGMYNETFVQIPSSFGQMDVFYRILKDSNYYDSETPFVSDSSSGYIENVDENDVEDGKLFTGISAYAIYDDDDNKGYVIENEDCAELVLSIDTLRDILDDQTLTLDKMSIDNNISDNFTFNAVLIYYSILSPSGNTTIATNAYGILLLNNPIVIGTGVYKFPELLKLSSTPTTNGTSFSFRLNTQTTSAYQGDIIITDESTPAYSMSEDFTGVINNLNSAISTLRSNSYLLYLINSDNTAIKELALSAIDKVDSISTTIEKIVNGEINDVSANAVVAESVKPSTLLVSDEGISIERDDFGSEDNMGPIGSIDRNGIHVNMLDTSYGTIDSLDSSVITTESLYTKSINMELYGDGDEVTESEADAIISKLVPKKLSDTDEITITSADSNLNSVSIYKILGAILAKVKNM